MKQVRRVTLFQILVAFVFVLGVSLVEPPYAIGGKVKLPSASDETPVTVQSDKSAVESTSQQFDKARSLMAGKKYEAAAHLLSHVRSDKARYFLAVCHYKSGKLDKALAALEFFTSGSSTSLYAPKARMLKASIFLDRKDYKKGEALLRAEASTLLSDGRKKDIAAIYFELVDSALGDSVPKAANALKSAHGKIPSPGLIPVIGKLNLSGKDADFDKALRLLNYLSKMDVPEEVLEQSYYRRGQVALVAKKYYEAINYFKSYLERFDSLYRDEILGGNSSIPFILDGRNSDDARLGLVEAELKRNNSWPEDTSKGYVASAVDPSVITLLDNLIRHLSISAAIVGSEYIEPENLVKALYFQPLAAGLMLKFQKQTKSGSYSPGAARRAVALANDFISNHRTIPRSVELARLIGPALLSAGFVDEAKVALEDMKNGFGLKLSADSRDRFNEYRGKAHFQLGQACYGSGDYLKAEEVWRSYTKEYSEGSDWASAQSGIYRALTSRGANCISNGDFDGGRKLWRSVLGKSVSSSKAAWLALALAMTWQAEAEALHKVSDYTSITDQERKLFQKSLEEIRKAGLRYSQWLKSESAKRRAYIYQHRLNNPEMAVSEYRKSGDYIANKAVKELTGIDLLLKTPSVFRSNEKAHILATLRNVKKLKMKLYKVDLADFFSKYHTTENVRRLDLDLVSPDRSWEVSVTDYEPFRKIQRKIPLNIVGSGSYAVTAEAEGYEATVLVLSSDIEIITATSGKESLVLVKNALLDEPVEGAAVTLWSGTKKGNTLSLETGSDGVARGQMTETPKVKPSFFADYEGNVAFSSSSLPSLVFQTIASRGYLYTSRPVYLPGGEVSFRGVSRIAGNASYEPVDGQSFAVKLKAPDGKVLGEQKMICNGFGTFHGKVRLPARCVTGTYKLVATPSEVGNGVAFSRNFEVRYIKPAKLFLTIEPEAQSTVAGSYVKIRCKAGFYSGLPLSARLINLSLPDGRKISLTTDKKGEAVYTLDTTPFARLTEISLSGSIKGEQVQASTAVYLLPSAVKLSFVEPLTKASLGQRIELKYRATNANDAAVAKTSLTFKVFHQKKPGEFPIDSNVLTNAGIDLSSIRAVRDSLLLSQVLRTDGSGHASFSFIPEVEGALRIALIAKDKKGRESVLSHAIQVSAILSKKLSFEVSSASVKVDDTVPVTIQSNGPSGLGLLLYTGDTILGYRVFRYKKGTSSFSFKVSNSYFPSMKLIGLATSEQSLERAEQLFKVNRALTLSLVLPKGPFAPGEEINCQVLAKDQQGKPVEAEFSLALLDKAILSEVPDKSGNIVTWFEKGLNRNADFKASSSASFARTGKKQKIASEVLAEGNRLKSNEKKKELRRDYSKKRAKMRPIVSRQSARGIGSLMAECEEDMDSFSASSKISAPNRSMSFASGRVGGKSGFFFDGEDRGSRLKADAAAPARKELPVGAFWLGSVVTGSDGRAQVKVRLPERTTSYKIQLRGVTKSSLFSEIDAELTISRSFFADLKLPEFLMEGDQVAPVLTIHNNGKKAVSSKVIIQIEAGSVLKNLEFEKQVSSRGSVDVSLPLVKVPNGQSFKVTVTLFGNSSVVADKFEQSSRILPFGVERTDGSFGSSDRDILIDLSLGADVPKETMNLNLALFRTMDKLVLNEMSTLSDGGFSTVREQALQAVALLKVRRSLTSGREHELKLNQLKTQIMASLSVLLEAQKSNGSWALLGGQSKHNLSTDYSGTSWAAVALSMARKDGFISGSQAIDKAVNWITNNSLNLGSSDVRTFEANYALAVAGKVSFSNLNRLYRERSSLKGVRRYLLALAFFENGKRDYAAKLMGSGVTPAANEMKYTYSSLYGNAVAATALIQLKTNPKLTDSFCRQIRKDVVSGNGSAAEKWLAIGALASSNGAIASSDPAFTLAVEVNGKDHGSYNCKNDGDVYNLSLPWKKLKSDSSKGNKVRIRLKYSGRGNYSYKAHLSGFGPVKKRVGTFYYGLYNELYYHSPKLYNSKELTKSQMKVSEVESNDYVEDYFSITSRKRGMSVSENIIITRYIPSGMKLDKTSIPESVIAHKIDGNKISLLFKRRPSSLRLRVLPYCPGKYRVLPAAMHALHNPSLLERLGKVRSIEVLAANVRSKKMYEWTETEHRLFGIACFENNEFKLAENHLSRISRKNRAHYSRVVKALLWIYCMPSFYKGHTAEIVDLFEVLASRYSTVNIPYEKLMVIGNAYHLQGEDEAACYLWRSTLSASFRDDVPVASELESSGEYLRAVKYLRDLYWAYPDEPNVVQSLYGLGQDIYGHKGSAASYGKVSDEMVILSLDVLDDFLALFPSLPYSDEATFSQLNSLREVDAHKACLARAIEAVNIYPKSSFKDRFSYIQALAAFDLGSYPQAIKAATAVAASVGNDKTYATFLLGQMYQALGKYSLALTSYRKVKQQFSDAALSIDYLERRSLRLPEVVRSTSGEPVKLEISHCNALDVEVKAYRVNLMRLYLKEKNLDRVAGVALAGITPTFTFERKLNGSEQGTTGKTSIDLPIREDGAYLVLVRSGDVFASSLALISSLKMEVQEYDNTVRVTVLEDREGKLKPLSGVHVKASNGHSFLSNETDLRGTVTLQVRGGTGLTVVSRRGKDEYAFYRSSRSVPAKKLKIPSRKMVDFSENIRSANMMVQQRAAQQLRGSFGRRSMNEMGVTAAQAKQ